VELRPLTGLYRHPAAGVLPEMEAEAFRAFVVDVRERGVQVPLDITAAGVVLDGHLRLRAAATLNLSCVPVRVVAPADEVEYLLRAAISRRHLTASQRAALAIELGMHIEAREASEARRLGNLKQNASEVATLPPRGKTRELIAELAGVSARTVQDAITTYEGDVGLFREVKEGRLAVAAAARRVRRRRRDEGIDPPPPLPEGVFDLIYADPPWRLSATDTERGPDGHYPTMPLEDIAAMRVPAAENAVLFLWAVDGHLPEALRIVDDWGFTYVNSFIWVKHHFGLGAWNRNQHEQLLVATRGGFSPPPPDLRQPSVINAKRGRHSQKPTAVYERLERMYPHAAKLELFARRARPGWTAWGNEAPDA
jgi:N6-adenosine-specific RNA methylase IME4